MIEKLKKEINNLGNKKQAEILAKYFKTGKGEYGEGDTFLGIKMDIQRKISKKYYNEISLRDIASLLKYNIHEYRMIAILCLIEKYEKEDKEKIFKFYLKNIKRINNWDLVDVSAPKIIGNFLFDKKRDILYKMATSNNLWEKRISLISTLFFISKGEIKDSLSISKILLEDKHDLIHKATGWVLREVGKKDEKSLQSFLKENYQKLNRTTLRYSIEKFEKKERKKWLSKGSISTLISLAISMNFIIPLIFSDIKRDNLDYKEINSIYLTGWSASSNNKIKETIDFIKETEINSVVIDIKDYSGYVFYKTDIEEVKSYGAEKIIIRDIKSLLKEFKDNGVYTIARIVIFQDPILAKARPDLAIKDNFNKGTIWKDKSGLYWIDPSSKEAWDYNLKIIKDAFDKGFDEVNLDYIRFPSDGNLSSMDFPFWKEEIPKRAVIREFSEYIRKNTIGKKMSADLFGLITINKDDLGIGQVLEDIAPYFDYLCPMVYPSHYADGFIGYKNPAEYPYEVIAYSLEKAKERIDNLYEIYSLEEMEKPYYFFTNKTKIRPWLQDFNMGAIYDANMVRKEIEATKDTLKEDYNGYMLWNPKNIYTKGALINN